MMKNSTNLEDKIEGAKKFWAWIYRVLLILEENDLEYYVKGGVANIVGDEDKTKEFKKIIADSTKDHLIPHVSSLKTPMEIFNVLKKIIST